MQDFVVLKTQAKVRKNLINLIKSGRRGARQIGKISVVSQSFGEIIRKKQQSDRSESFVWTEWQQGLRVNKFCWKLLLPPVSQLFIMMNDCIGTSCTNRTMSPHVPPLQMQLGPAVKRLGVSWHCHDPSLLLLPCCPRCHGQISAFRAAPFISVKKKNLFEKLYLAQRGHSKALNTCKIAIEFAC